MSFLKRKKHIMKRKEKHFMIDCLVNIQQLFLETEEIQFKNSLFIIYTA